MFKQLKELDGKAISELEIDEIIALLAFAGIFIDGYRGYIVPEWLSSRELLLRQELEWKRRAADMAFLAMQGSTLGTE